MLKKISAACVVGKRGGGVHGWAQIKNSISEPPALNEAGNNLSAGVEKGILGPGRLAHAPIRISVSSCFQLLSDI